MKSIKQMSDAFCVVDGKRKTPMPFPGRYPTRWRMDFTFVSGKRIVRITKPNPCIAKLWIWAYSTVGGVIQFTEFDRGGAIRTTALLDTPRLDTNVAMYNAGLCYLYSPWAGWGPDFFYAWRGKARMWPLKIIFRKKTFVIYTPYEDMVFTEGAQANQYLGMLREYKKWLQAQKFAS